MLPIRTKARLAYVSMMLGSLLAAMPLAADETDPSTTQDELESISTELPEFRRYGAVGSAEDAEAISNLLQRLVEAWTSADADGAVAAYANDAEWVNAFGDVRRGHDELRAQFAHLFERFESDSQGSGEAEGSAVGESEEAPMGSALAMRRGLISMRYIGANVAVLHSYTESDWGENRDDESGVRHVRMTFVLEKRDGEWLIVHHMIMDARS